MKKYRAYLDLQEEYDNGHVPYAVLLTAKEWRKKRELIIRREKNTCQVCQKRCIDGFKQKGIGYKNFKVIYVPVMYDFYVTDTILTFTNPITNEVTEIPSTTTGLRFSEVLNPHFAHVHHTYYVMSKLPWEYPDEDLMLVCHKCHFNIHETQVISVYMDEKRKESVQLIPCTRCNGAGHFPQFEHVQNGICFQCNGACFEEWIE